MATQGSPLAPEFRRAIVLVKEYFDRIKSDLFEQECSSAERTAHALGVGVSRLTLFCPLFSNYFGLHIILDAVR